MKNKNLFIAVGVTMLLSCIIAFISCKSDDNSSLENKSLAGTWLMYDQEYCKKIAVLNSNGQGCVYLNCDGSIEDVNHFTYSYNVSTHVMTVNLYDSYDSYYSYYESKYKIEYYIAWKSEDCIIVSYENEYYGIETMELVRISNNQNTNVENDYDYYDYYGYDDWYYTNARRK